LNSDATCVRAKEKCQNDSNKVGTKEPYNIPQLAHEVRLFITFLSHRKLAHKSQNFLVFEAPLFTKSQNSLVFEAPLLMCVELLYVQDWLPSCVESLVTKLSPSHWSNCLSFLINLYLFYLFGFEECTLLGVGLCSIVHLYSDHGR
jgi:hypothetical protein